MRTTQWLKERDAMMPYGTDPQPFSRFFEAAKPYTTQSAQGMGKTFYVEEDWSGTDKDFHLPVGPYLQTRDGDSLAVTPTDEIVEYVKQNMIYSINESFSFEIVKQSDGDYLLLVRNSQIIGSRWLAYLDPATVPDFTERKPYPYAKGDKVRDIYTGERFTVIRSYWQDYEREAIGSGDYTVELEATETQPTPWNKSTSLAPIK